MSCTGPHLTPTRGRACARRRRSTRAALAVLISVSVGVLGSSCGARTDAGAAADRHSPPASATPAGPTLPEAILPDGSRIALELAITREEISQGLMFRPSLPEDRGMLFLLQIDRVPSFWMKNTIIPLDLVFLDRGGRVVDIIENARPCAADPCPQYVSRHPARAVLELAAGVASRHGLAVGDVLAFARVQGYPVRSEEQSTAANRGLEE